MTQADQAPTTTSYPDYDPYDPNTGADQIRTQYREMQDLCPVAHVPHHGGFDVVTRYDDARDVAAQPKTFSSADGSFIVPSGFPPIPPLDFDEPDHRRWVKLMQPPLTLAAVRELEPRITEIVNDHIDRFAAAGEAELFSALAEPVPVDVIAGLVGLDPEAAVEMRRVGMNVFAAIGTDEFDRHMQAFTDFTDAELAARRENPRGDYLSELASGELNGETIDDVGSAGIMVALLVGGHHSTASALAGLVHHVLSTPGLAGRLAEDPDLLDRTIEESLRLTTPLQFFTRTTTEDTEVSGCPVPAGRRVVLNFGAANRDRREFPEPDMFDPDRARNKHLAFGHGIHLCIGRHLARAELRIALTELLRRLPDIRLDGDPVEPGYIGSMMLSIVELRVRFTPAR
jgi:cytochrome P450